MSSRIKLNRKKIILAISVLLVFAVASSYFVFFNSKQAEAAWWNDSWQYRKSIAVTNSSGSSLTDFQVKVLTNVDLSADVTAGKIQSDLDDLRFTDINGDVLSYWLEDTTTSSVDAWVKLPSLTIAGATVYMYYGNPNAASAQNGNNVFTFFDDFSGDLSKWVNPCSAAVTAGVMNINSSTGCDTTPVYANNLNLSDATGYIMEFKGKFSSGGDGRLQLYQRRRNANGYVARFWTSGVAATWYQEYTGSWVSDANVGANNMSADTWYTLKAQVNGSNNTFYVNGTSIGSAAASASLTPFTDLTVGLGEYSTTVQYDDVRVRKYASTDPSAAAPGSEEKGAGPAAYWSFDEGFGTTAFDATANRNNGALTNMSATASSTSGWQTEDRCVSGKCLAFDGGNDYVSIADNASLNTGASGITLSAWVKIFQAGNRHDLIDSTGSGYNGYMLRINNTNTVSLVIASSSADQTFTGDGAISANVWTHIVATWDGTTNANSLKIYINGALDKQGTATVSGIINPGRNLIIGTEAGLSLSNPAKGLIDEPKIYSYARSAAQIKLDYNAGLAGQGGAAADGAAVSAGGRSPKWMSDGLVGYWKMDEATSTWNGTANEAVDSSGGGNHGAAAGNASTTAGKFGNGGIFDGSGDYVTTTYNGVYNFDDSARSFTISAWVRSSADGKIINRGWGSSLDYSLYISSNNAGFDRWGSAHPAATASDRNYNDSQWHHLVGVKDAGAGTLKIYTDGVLRNTATDTSGTTNAGTLPVAFGIHYYSVAFLSDPLTGRIDEARVYNRALSDREVRDLYAWAPGPVGYWNMEEGRASTVVNDISGNGNTGTIYPGTAGANTATSSMWTAGKFGKGLKFDGADDNVSVPHVNMINPLTNSYTISGWFKTASASQMVLFDKNCNGSNNDGFIVRQESNGTVSAAFMNIGGARKDVTTTGSSIKDGVWHYVAIRLDRNTSPDDLRIFIDGQDKSGAQTNSLDGESVLDSNPLLIGQGRTVCSGGAPWDGQIDDVRIYNYARTQKQIVEDMNAGHPAGGSPVGSQVGYWKFDEGYGTTQYDSSPQKNNATSTGATWTNNGKFGKALSFDGSGDYVNAGSASSLDMGVNDFSVSFWIKLNSGNVQPDRIVNKYNDTGWDIIYHDNGTIYFETNNGGWLGFNSTTVLGTSNWRHVAVTKASTTASIYIDGKLDTSGTVQADVSDAASALYLGCQSDGSTNCINALLDEVKVYNYALNADEVRLDYNHGKSMSLGSYSQDSSGAASSSAASLYCVPGSTDACSAPVGEWKLEEGSGASAQDTSGNGNTGTWYGTGSHWTQGKVGKAGKFDGSSDYVELADSNSLDLTTDITISAWAKFNDFSQAGGHAIVARHTNGYILSVYSDAQGGSARKITWGKNGIDELLSTVTLTTNTWYYITATRTGGINYIYINGVLNNSGAKNDFVALGDSIMIGDSVPHTGGFKFNGIIDDVRIFNYARTAAQVAWDYNKGKPVGWWKMDEGEGVLAHDASSNKSNGTIYPGAAGIQTATSTMWTSGASGKRNGSLNFDGTDDYAEMSNESNFDFTADFSISLWLNASSTISDYAALVTKYSANAGWDLILNGSPNLGVPRMALRGTSLLDNDGNIPANYDLRNQGWKHLTVVNTNTSIKTYIDGKLVATYTGTWTATANNQAVQLGTRAGALPFAGKLDDVRIYNYALTAAQVRDVYGQGAVRFGQ